MASLPLSALPACLCGTVTQDTASGADPSRFSASMFTCRGGRREMVTRLSRGKRWNVAQGNIRSLAGFTKTLAAGRECSTRSLKYLCESAWGLMRHSLL